MPRRGATWVQCMQELRGQVWHDLRLETARSVGGLSLVRCTFEGCFVGGARTPEEMPCLSNLLLTECRAGANLVNTAILSDITVDRLDVTDRIGVFFDCCFFKHVTLKGKLGRLKVNIEP